MIWYTYTGCWVCNDWKPKQNTHTNLRGGNCLCDIITLRVCGLSIMSSCVSSTRSVSLCVKLHYTMNMCLQISYSQGHGFNPTPNLTHSTDGDRRAELSIKGWVSCKPCYRRTGVIYISPTVAHITLDVKTWHYIIQSNQFYFICYS